MDGRHDPAPDPDGETSGQDRRRYLRTSCVASAAVVVAGGSYVGTYVVENISAGGAFLVGSSGLALEDRVEIVLQMGDRSSVPVSARIARVEGQAFAVEFQDVPDSMRTALVETVRARQHPGSARRTIVVHSDAPIRLALESDLTALGQSVVSLGNPEAAMRWLRTSSDALGAAFIDPVLEEALPMLGLIETRFPDSRRILIFDLATAPRSLKKMIASDAVQSLLYNPWTPLSLTSSLFFGGFSKQSARRCLDATQTGA